jgi:hypothetical protein
MLESALQKLLMLLLFFGKPLWQAADTWGDYAIRQLYPAYQSESMHLGWMLSMLYVGIYALGGLLIARFGVRLPRLLDEERATNLAPEITIAVLDKSGINKSKSGSARARKRRRMLVWLGLMILVACTWFIRADESEPVISGAVYFLRTLAIVLFWYFVLGPWLAGRMRQWLLGRRSANQGDLDQLFDLIPLLRVNARTQFSEMSRSYSGLSLYRRWLIRVLAISLEVKLPLKQDT